MSADPRHRWCKGTFTAYCAIIQQLEKYWVLAVVYTTGKNTASTPHSSDGTSVFEVIGERLKQLSAIATREISQDDVSGAGAGGAQQQQRAPLSHAVMACERPWSSLDTVLILKGACADIGKREVATLQKARLHVLENAKRWREAYHYAIFHGHVFKALMYLVRADRQPELLQMICRQRELTRGGRCVAVCSQLVSPQYIARSGLEVGSAHDGACRIVLCLHSLTHSLSLSLSLSLSRAVSLSLTHTHTH